jgi:diketogulonate reductase-like aldo/keto reductase
MCPSRLPGRLWRSSSTRDSCGTLVSGSLFTPYGHHIKLRKTLFHSNYNGALLLDLQRYARIEPAVLQIEHHPYLVQQPLLDLVKTLGIAVTAYSSYGPQTWRELDMHQKVPSLFENDAITTIAKRHGKSASVVSAINRFINIYFISTSKRPSSLGDSARACCYP